MTIHKKVPASKDKLKAEDTFISGAPDVKHSASASVVASTKGITKGNKRQISITIDPLLLSKLDNKAVEMGIGRSAFITLCVFQALNS